MLKPTADDRVLVEAAARVQLELGSSGFTSALVDVVGDDAPARVAFVREDGVATIDVVGTRPDATSVHRRVVVADAEGGNDGAVLALRAVEILRGIRLDERPEVRAAAAPPATTLDADLAAPAASGAWRLALGPSALEGRPWGASVAPGLTLQVSAPLTLHVSFVLTAAGPFFNDLPATPDGSAHTREELAFFGLGVRVPVGSLALQGVLGAGVHHLVAAYDARGAPTMPPPSELHLVSSQSLWSPFVGVGAGASRQLWRRAGVSFEVVAVVAQPAVDVVVNGRALGKSGGPSLLESLTVWVAFP